MKVLVVHNAYQQSAGEDRVVAAEIKQLVAHGDSVVRYDRHNDELRGIGPVGAITAAVRTIWASPSYREISQLLSREKPDIAHFHNTFPLISPSAYYACAEAGVPVVQTLHNYRLLCPASTLMRNGGVCEDCVGCTLPWAGILHRCYHKSTAQTAVVAGMIAVHHLLQTWKKKVSAYIALSDFARRKFTLGGMPFDQIHVKPNFVHPDPGARNGRGEYALFVGRLAEEKGLRTLFSALKRLKQKIPLYIVGDGPLREELETLARREGLSHVALLGAVPSTEITRWMHGARFLVCPSLWFEGFPLIIAEAFACGLPVICSRLGSLQEIVDAERTGVHFTPGDPADLALAIEWAWASERQLGMMGRQARVEYERKYTAERNYRAMIRIYGEVLDCAGKPASKIPASVWKAAS
jgi:glycosyltransferase involved in cell wall biosynthesis